MIRATLAGLVSVMFPGIGHIMINFQIFKGFLIMFLYMVYLTFMFGSILFGIGIGLGLLLPFIHLGAGWMAYTDSK